MRFGEIIGQVRNRTNSGESSVHIVSEIVREM